MTVVESVTQIALPIAQTLCLELVDVEYVKKGADMHLTLFIDKVGGVSIKDCEALHKAVDEPLDNADPTQGKPYTLNVSSLGLDRPLKTARDFERNLNKKVVLKLYAAVNKVKNFVGILTGYTDDTVTILCKKDTTLTFEIKAVALMQQYIEF